MLDHTFWNMKQSSKKTPRSRYLGRETEEQGGSRLQEAIDRCVATEIARGDVEAKLIPKAVAPEMKRPKRPAFSQEYRILREMQKRGRTGETPPSVTEKNEELREPKNPPPTSPEAISIPQVSPFTFASTLQPHRTPRQRHSPAQTDTKTTITPHRPRSPSRRRRRHGRSADEPNDAGHKSSPHVDDEPSSQEVVLSLTFSDEEIEQVKARARRDPNATTMPRRRPKEEEQGQKATISTRRQGLHPSIALNMRQNRDFSNQKMGEDDDASNYAIQAASEKVPIRTESSSLESASAHVTTSKKVWVAKRRRRQSTGSSRPLHIAEMLFGDDAKSSGATFDMNPAPTSGPERKITGCLLQCSDSESQLSDINSESVDYSDSNDDEDSAYALAMARTNLERKLAKDARNNVDEKGPARRPTCSHGSHSSTRDGDDVETELRQSQPGAFAVQGFRSTDSLSHDSLSMGMSLYSDQGQVNTDLVTGAVVDAEVHEDVVVDGSVLVEEEVVDQKTKKRLRVMQLVILCLVMGSVALVTGSIVDFAPNGNENEKGIVGWTSVGDAIFGSTQDAQTLFGSSVRLNHDSSRLVVTSPGSDDGTNLNVGKVFILDKLSGVNGEGSWTVASTLEGSGQSSDAAMSLAISESADKLAVGYPRLDTGGFVEILAEKKGATTGWEVTSQFYAHTLGINDRSWFGHSVGLSKNGTVLVVSSPLQEVGGQSVGAVHIFKEGTNGTWFPKGDPIFGQFADEFFGWSIDLSGDGNILAVGAPVVNDATGIVRVYRWSGSSWLQLGDDLEGERLYTRFGESVALSKNGELLAVGSRGLAIEPGQAHVYRLNDLNEWELEQSFAGQEAGEEFGSALALSDDGAVLAIGAPQSNNFGDTAGRVELHRRNEQSRSWELQGSPIGSASLENFGTSVSLSGDGFFVAGGAPSTAFDESVIRAGAVRVFRQE